MPISDHIYCNHGKNNAGTVFFRIVLILLLVNLQCAEATLYHLCMTLFQVFKAVPVG